jgi:hypothetical protein
MFIESYIFTQQNFVVKIKVKVSHNRPSRCPKGTGYVKAPEYLTFGTTRVVGL